MEFTPKVESSNKGFGSTYSAVGWWSIIENYPEAAKFFLDKKLWMWGIPQTNVIDYKNRALWTCVRAGDQDSLDDLYNNEARNPKFLGISDGVISAAIYFAENGCGTGCVGWQITLTKYFINYNKEFASKMYLLLLSNRMAKNVDKFLTAKAIGDKFFTNKYYGEAAGWYYSALRIDIDSFSDELIKDSFSKNVTNEAFRSRIFGYGKNIADILNEAKQRPNKEYEIILKRLSLIKDAGIQTIPAF